MGPKVLSDRSIEGNGSSDVILPMTVEEWYAAYLLSGCEPTPLLRHRVGHLDELADEKSLAREVGWYGWAIRSLALRGLLSLDEAGEANLLPELLACCEAERDALFRVNVQRFEAEGPLVVGEVCVGNDGVIARLLMGDVGIAAHLLRSASTVDFEHVVVGVLRDYLGEIEPAEAAMPSIDSIRDVDTYNDPAFEKYAVLLESRGFMRGFLIATFKGHWYLGGVGEREIVVLDSVNFKEVELEVAKLLRSLDE